MCFFVGILTWISKDYIIKVSWVYCLNVLFYLTLLSISFFLCRYLFQTNSRDLKNLLEYLIARTYDKKIFITLTTDVNRNTLSDIVSRKKSEKKRLKRHFFQRQHLEIVTRCFKLFWSSFRSSKVIFSTKFL